MRLILAAFLFAFAALAAAQHDSHKMDTPAAKAQAPSHRAVGVVKAVNAGKGTVSIAHEPVESLKWPGMTMGFKAKDKKVLDGLKPGQKIEFEFVQQGKDYVITKVR